RSEVRDGVYTGRPAGPLTYRDGKADAVRALAERDGIDLHESYAYSDSESDLPLLRLVGHPVAVNPDRALERVAREEGWRVIRFDKLGRRLRIAAALAAVAPLALLSLVGGAVAVTPGYGHGWYRLYDACQSDALRDVAGAAELDAKATVITGSWQAKLVLAALADDANRVWYSTTYFTSEANRAGLASRHVIAVFEPHLAEADTDFFAGPGWSLLGRWCPGPDGPSVSAYVHGALP
ncbi:MAG: HAD family hydrolase, partial [Thermoplasmatota archaeon]